MTNVITEKFEKELVKFFKWANQSGVIVIDKKNGDKKVEWEEGMINYTEPARNKLEIFLKGVIEEYTVYENDTLIDDNKLLTVKYKLNKPKRKNAKKNVDDNIEKTVDDNIEEAIEAIVIEKVSKNPKKEKEPKTPKTPKKPKKEKEPKKPKTPKTPKESKKEKTTTELTQSLENMKIKDNENAKNQEFEKVFDNNVPEPKMYSVKKGQVQTEDTIERIKCNYQIDLQGLI